ncbi:hypothetical protein [Rhizobium halophilum]|uniref:hypothetical protein n=1 Tax=Rhizobium halophilum TaxID=2846852 RepID=UPI001EFD0969|nr:hypothetical protein [Rhizobium halophilum]MCF6370918.1 hypothetical protein [Rhizobium halophilum]
MRPKKQALVIVAALLLAVSAGSFFFYVQDFASTSSTRLEEPYKRTEDAPPGAITDEMSHPDLANGNSEAQAQ